MNITALAFKHGHRMAAPKPFSHTLITESSNGQRRDNDRNECESSADDQRLCNRCPGVAGEEQWPHREHRVVDGIELHSGLYPTRSQARGYQRTGQEDQRQRYQSGHEHEWLRPLNAQSQRGELSTAAIPLNQNPNPLAF